MSLRLRETKKLVRGHNAKNWSSKNLNPSVVAPKLVVFPLQYVPPTWSLVLNQICDHLITLH